MFEITDLSNRARRETLYICKAEFIHDAVDLAAVVIPALGINIRVFHVVPNG